MTNDSEKRQEYRLPAQETVYVELAASSQDGQLPTSIIVGNSVDISANGLRILSGEDIPIGSIHATSIQLDKPDCRLQLVTEVKWSRKLEGRDEYLIGLELFESEGTDIQRWKEIIAERCGR